MEFECGYDYFSRGVSRQTRVLFPVCFGFVRPMSVACMDASHWSLFSVSDPCSPKVVNLVGSILPERWVSKKSIKVIDEVRAGIIDHVKDTCLCTAGWQNKHTTELILCLHGSTLWKDTCKTSTAVFCLFLWYIFIIYCHLFLVKVM